MVSDSGSEAKYARDGSISMSPGVKSRERIYGGVSRYVSVFVRNALDFGVVDGRRITWSIWLADKEFASRKTVFERVSRSSDLVELS